jgi:hypothetical protein
MYECIDIVWEKRKKESEIGNPSAIYFPIYTGNGNNVDLADEKSYRFTSFNSPI